MTIPWLDKPVKEVKVEVEFGGGGLIDVFGNFAPTMVQYLWRQYLPEKPVQNEHFPDCFPDFYTQAGADAEGGHWVYWKIANGDKANLAAQWISEYTGKNRYNPNRVVFTSLPTSEILNWTEDMKSKWQSGEMTNDFTFGATLGAQYSAMYHLVWLPAMVCAVGNYQRDFGKSDVDFSNVPKLEYPLLNLVDKPDKEVQIGDETHPFGSDKVWFYLIGDHTQKNEDHEDHPLNSYYGKARARLWETLGETNPKANSPIGGKSNVTTSELLSACLSFAQASWGGDTWAKTVTLADPHPDHNYNGKQDRVIAVTALYPSREEALKAMEEQENRRGELIAKANGEVTGFGEYQTQEAFLEALATTLYETYKIDAMPKKLKEKKAFESETLPEIASELGVEVDIIKSNLDNAFELM